MILTNPIIIDFPAFTKADGTLFTRPALTLNQLDFILSDSPKRKIAQVKIHPFPYPLVLWSNSEYDAIGDYTQAQIENKINEYILINPKVQLEKLFLPIQQR